MYFLNAFLCLQLDFLKIAPLLYRGNIEKRWAIGFRRNLLDMRRLNLLPRNRLRYATGPTNYCHEI
jgi:hypothetical protein